MGKSGIGIKVRQKDISDFFNEVTSSICVMLQTNGHENNHSLDKVIATGSRKCRAVSE